MQHVHQLVRHDLMVAPLQASVYDPVADAGDLLPVDVPAKPVNELFRRLGVIVYAGERVLEHLVIGTNGL
jgi:hypothetical protein